MEFKNGTRIQILEGWEGTGDKGAVLGTPVFVEQYWIPVKMDKDEDPTFVKYASIGGEIIPLVRRVAQIVHDKDKWEWYIYIGDSDKVTGLSAFFSSEQEARDHIAWLEGALDLKFELQIGRNDHE